MLRHAHGIRVEEEQLVCFVWLDDGKVGSFIYYFFFPLISSSSDGFGFGHVRFPVFNDLHDKK